MKTANIAVAKDQFSRLVQRARRGEFILITDRNKPVAQLGPVQHLDEVVARLVAEGIVLPPQGPPLDVRAFLKAPRPKLSARHSLAKAVLEERVR